MKLFKKIGKVFLCIYDKIVLRDYKYIKNK